MIERRNMNPNRTLRYIVVGILSGLILFCCFAYIAFLYSIHDEFRIAAYLFPYAVFMSPGYNYLSFISVLIAFVQWPLYGAVLSLHLKERRGITRAVVVVCLLTHVIIGTLAWARVNSAPVRIVISKKE